MRIDSVSTSGIWVRQVPCCRDNMYSKNTYTGNTCLSLQLYHFPPRTIYTLKKQYQQLHHNKKKTQYKIELMLLNNICYFNRLLFRIVIFYYKYNTILKSI